jgi:membrane-bound lytic murein transglycosylase D
MNARAVGLALALWLVAAPCVHAAEAEAAVLTPAGTRNGQEIYQSFRDGLADPVCKADASTRWQAHFAHAPKQLAARNDDVLPLFGYVVDAVRKAHLPTEYALIPFVESGYKPGARSPQGPAGLWQMIAITARNHKVPMRVGYDGRLSPVDSTAAAVRYLKTLHGMFAGDWRLAVMAYNAGEYRVLGALRRGGQTARNARPEALPGLSPITQAYVRKLHALSCLMEQAEDRADWLRALDRPVPLLQAVNIPEGVGDITTWAKRNGQDAAQLQRLNPAYANGRLSRAEGKPARLLAVATTATVGSASQAPTAGAVDTVTNATTPVEQAAVAIVAPDTAPATVADAATSTPIVPAASATASDASASPSARRHVVARGDSASKIAARYDISVSALLQRNALTASSVLRPGKVLLIDPAAPMGDLPTAAGPP